MNDFFCDAQFLRYDRFCIFFLQDLAEIWIKYIYFLSGWLRPLHRACPGAGRFKIDTKSEQVSVNGIFCKARLCCFPVKHSSPMLLLSNVKYKTDNYAKTKNRTKKTHEFKKSDQNNAHLLFFHLGKNLGIFLTQKWLKVTISQN